MEAFQEELKGLPESYKANPQGNLLELCNRFIAEVQEYMKGSPHHLSFFKDLSEIFSTMQNEINCTRPPFEVVPKEAPKEGVVQNGTHGQSLSPPSSSGDRNSTRDMKAKSGQSEGMILSEPL
jgi:hypothetical protein